VLGKQGKNGDHYQSTLAFHSPNLAVYLNPSESKDGYTPNSEWLHYTGLEKSVSFDRLECSEYLAKVCDSPTRDVHAGSEN